MSRIKEYYHEEITKRQESFEDETYFYTQYEEELCKDCEEKKCKDEHITE